MTISDRGDIRSNSKYGTREYRGWEICANDLNSVYEHRYNEFSRDSAIYIHTNWAYNNRIWAKCKFMNRGNIIRICKKRIILHIKFYA